MWSQPPVFREPTYAVTYLGLDASPREVANQHLHDVRLAARGQPHHHQDQLALHGREAHEVRLERLPPRVLNQGALVRLLQRHHVRVGAQAPGARGEGPRVSRLPAQHLVPPRAHHVEEAAREAGVQHHRQNVVRHRHGWVGVARGLLLACALLPSCQISVSLWCLVIAAWVGSSSVPTSDDCLGSTWCVYRPILLQPRARHMVNQPAHNNNACEPIYFAFAGQSCQAL